MSLKKRKSIDHILAAYDNCFVVAKTLRDSSGMAKEFDVVGTYESKMFAADMYYSLILHGADAVLIPCFSEQELHAKLNSSEIAFVFRMFYNRQNPSIIDCSDFYSPKILHDKEPKPC